MLKFFIRLGLVLLVFNTFLSSCEGLRNRRDDGKEYDLWSYKVPERVKFSLNAANALADLQTERGIGLSAWGIVIVVVSIILAIMGMYYFSICYPVLCNKTKKYDTMGLTPNV